MVSLAELLSDLPAEIEGDPSVEITALVTDSRQAQPGSLFIALRGTHTDGHLFLADAAARGAVAALVERWPEDDQRSSLVATARVPDTRVALSAVAARFYDFPARSLGLIGVTGTDGKTTTTYLIDSMLRTAGYQTGLIGTVAIRIGAVHHEHDLRQTTPDAHDVQRMLRAMCDVGVQWAVLEATSHGLELHRLDHCPFDIATVTNVTQEHLDFHKTVENYRRAKGRLLELVATRGDRPYPSGIVLNADDEGARSLAVYAGRSPILWYSKLSDAPLRADAITVSNQGTSFQLIYQNQSTPVSLRLIGSWNVDNALAAAGVGIILGLPLEAIARGLAALPAVPGRFTPVRCGQPFTVIVDYAHTPEAFQKVLPLARTLTSGRVIVVFGSAGERDRVKRGRQGAIAARLADFAVITSEDPRFEDPWRIIDEIAAGARAAGAEEGKHFIRIEDRREAIREAFRRARPGDIVLLLGKGHERCIIYGEERRPWDECAEARQALHEMGYDCDDSC